MRIATWACRVFNWRMFFIFLQQEIKAFFYLLFLLTLLRIGFIGWMHAYIGSGVTNADLWAAFVYGTRLSLKSAGALALISATVGLLFYLFLPQYGDRMRRLVGGSFVFLLTFLFCARIPYYAQFHSGFNQLIFNAVHDDVYALLVSLVEQFHLPLRLLGATLLAWVLYWLFLRWLRVPEFVLPTFRSRIFTWSLRFCFLYLVYLGTIFIQFGGSMSYEDDVGWENAAVTKDQLLNEAILDDMHALCRAYAMNTRLEKSTGLAFHPQEIRDHAAFLTGKSRETDQLDAFLIKRAVGTGSAKPRHIFLIVAESYANWPLLEKFENLHLADGLKGIIAEPDSSYANAFLPNGMSTISAIMGIVTGLADANLYLTSMPEAYTAPYSTAIAPQLHRLGYRARFWYAGPPSWEGVRDFSLAQGFQDFYGRGDFGAVSGNVWGCDDWELYRAVLDGTDSTADSFNLILNVSNHSPYTVDLAAEGFDRAALIAALPGVAAKDEALIRALGHFWYADRMLARFVKEAKRRYPDSLFVIVGDHADRVNVDKVPTMYERYGVPLVVSGKGIVRESLPSGAAGSHIDLTPTLIELIAPKGFAYYSVGTSLTRGNAAGVNYGFWITPTHIGKADAEFAPEQFCGGAPPDEALLTRYVAAVRAISWWRGKYGNELVKDAEVTEDGVGL